jgi:hypothetical protein
VRAWVIRKCDALADELRERYPVLAGELVDLLGRIRELDPEVRRGNDARPADAGAEATLLGVELHARKLKNICRDISPGELSLDKDLVLPDFADPKQKLWPPVLPENHIRA